MLAQPRPLVCSSCDPSPWSMTPGGTATRRRTWRPAQGTARLKTPDPAPAAKHFTCAHKLGCACRPLIYLI